NRIVRRHAAQISRDAAGRTRREQGLAMFGPLVDGGDTERQHVQISDPASKMTVLLDLANKVAHRMPAPQFRVAPGQPGASQGMSAGSQAERLELAVPGPGPGSGMAAGVHVFAARRAGRSTPAAEPVIEALGAQFMEGLTVDGTRTTVTIPAGQIGNELPIHIV